MNEIEFASIGSLNRIAKCHISSFPKSLSSKLGIGFVTDILGWYLSSPNNFLFFLVENKIVVGYCGGYLKDGSENYGAASGMTQVGFNSAFYSLIKKPWLFFHLDLVKKYPFVFKNIIRKFGFLKEEPLHKEIKDFDFDNLICGLVVIGVHPKFRKKGIGSKLLNEFEIQAKERGANLISLTVKKNNENAIASYLKNNYQFSTENESEETYLMTKKIY